MANQNQTRSLSAIAADIRAHWPRVYFGAVPYLEAMGTLEHVSDSYGLDPGDHIVRYFLSNASAWRGEHARRIKAELREMLPY